MGWAYCGTDKLGRDIGYSIAATCDQPGCKAEIDRGLGYICGYMHGDEQFGCGKYFCTDHLTMCQHPEPDGGIQCCAACLEIFKTEYAKEGWDCEEGEKIEGMNEMSGNQKSPAQRQYRGFIISADFQSPRNGRACTTQQGWRTSHPAFPGMEHSSFDHRLGMELGWKPTLGKAIQRINEFIATAKAGGLTAERRDTYMKYFPNEPRPMARDELTVEQQQAKNLADAMQAEWEADKAKGADRLAGILIEWACDLCEHETAEDLHWDDEQTLEVVEEAIAVIRRRLALAREV
jgi:hypothetical protein